VTAGMDILAQVKSGNPDFAKILQDVETTVADVK